MSSFSININSGGLFWSLTSVSQNVNTASKIDLVVPSSQNPDPFTLPRVPGTGKDFIVNVAPDFDAPIDFGQ